jgi:hypothetical protein
MMQAARKFAESACTTESHQEAREELLALLGELDNLAARRKGRAAS